MRTQLVKLTTKPPAGSIIISMSELALFNRCRKAYELGYVKNLVPTTSSTPAMQGSALHAELESYAHDRRGTVGPVSIDSTDDMFAVAQEYLKRRGAAGFDAMKRVLTIEEPVYTPIAPATSMLSTLVEKMAHPLPMIYLRTTFDLMYERTDGWIVARDYKSFEVAPSANYDLDFQGRLYAATAMIAFPGRQVMLEFENIRRSVPGTKRGAAPAAGKPDRRPVWTEDDCYIRQPLIISADEAKNVWLEARHIVAQILLTRAVGQTDPDAFYRQPLKAGPHSCSSCFYKHLCLADSQGSLDADFIAEFSTPRVLT
jgi:hypothetical protein